MSSKPPPTSSATGRTAIVKAVRVERELYAFAQKRIEAEDLDFSKYVRRLIRADQRGHLAISA